jgi:hypothetical protein
MAQTFFAGAVEAIRSIGGGPPLTLGFPEGSAQVFKKGDLLILTSGQVTLAGANPTGIVGVAEMDATGVQGSNVVVWLATKENIFIANFGTVAASVYTATTVPTTAIGLIGALTRATSQVATPSNITFTGRWVFDTAVANSTAQVVAGATNNARVVVHGIDTRDGIPGTDLGGRIHFSFLDFVVIQSGTATCAVQIVKAFSGL